MTIPIAKPKIDREEIEAIVKVMNSGVIAQGGMVKRFEELFARYIGTKHAVATNSGTAALHVSILAHGIGEGDEVITTPFSFIATANSILYSGAKPIFVDINYDDLNIDIEQVNNKITRKTKAIIPVHLYGLSCDMKEITELAEDHDLSIIEDACQAHGATYKGKKVGSFGTGCFSFYPTKNMTTGEGGIITTNNDEIEKRAKMIREHGSNIRYYHEILGYNYRMTDIAAAIGIEQLKKLDSFNESRINNAKLLSTGIDGRVFSLPKLYKNKEHVFHQYTIRSQNRDNFSRFLENMGIGYGIYYPIPIHKQPLYMKLGYEDKLPVSEKVAKEVISLPVHPSLTKEDLKYIIKTVNNFIPNLKV